MRQTQATPPLDSDVPACTSGRGDTICSARGTVGTTVTAGEWNSVRAELRTYEDGRALAWSATAFEVVILIRGSVTTLRPNNIVEGHAIHGTAWPSFPDCPQESVVRPQRDAEMLHIVLCASLVRSAQQQMSPGVSGTRGFRGFHDLLIEQIALEIIREMRHESYGGRLLVESLAQALTFRLLQFQARATPCLHLPARPLPRGAEQRMRRVLDLINDRGGKSLAIRELAAVVRMSPFHFSRTFKKLMGVSPIYYINDRRISLAKELLSKTHRTLLDIAHVCQFTTYSGFARAFRRATGITPADYRSRTAPA